jgi:hypothetical protein
VASLDIADDTFVVGDARIVARMVNEPARQRLWWPDLALQVIRDRGRQGVQWQVGGTWAGRAWNGTMEIWLEAVLDGVVLHHYARLDPVGPALHAKELTSLNVTYVTNWKRHVFALKDEVESTRDVRRQS